MLFTQQQGQVGRQTLLLPAKWDPATVSSPLALSNDSTRLELPTGNSSIAKTARAVRPMTSGKWYWEVSVADVINGNGTTTGVGICNSSQSLSANLATGTNANSLGWWCSGNYYNNGALVTTTSSWQDGSVLLFAFDADSGKFWIGLLASGGWLLSGNPATGANPLRTLSAPGIYYPAASPWSSSAETVKLDLVRWDRLNFAPPAGFQPYTL